MEAKEIARLLLVLSVIGLTTCNDFYTRTFSVPLRVFNGNMTYACITEPIAADQYLVEFEPQVQRDVIKHMSIFLCDEPGSTEPIWECVTPESVCKGQKESKYPWTNFAPGLKFPPNAGMHTGNRPRHMVFQMHGQAKGITGPEAEKTGGMAVTIRSSKPEYNIGIAIIGNVGHIPPLVADYKTDSSCMWNITKPAPIFGYALHSHVRGKTISGYIVRNGKWIELGKGDPRYPLTFFDIAHKNMFLQKGDILAVRCTFDNPTNHFIKFGHHAYDEMCNFYIHYGVPLDAPGEDRSYICSNDAMSYHWEYYLEYIPEDSTDISGDTEQRLFAKAHKDFILKY